MEKKKVVPVWVSVVLLVLLVFGIVVNFITMADSWNIPLRIIDTIACILALFYCMKGYSKNAAVYFNAFCIAYCISLMIPIFLVAGMYEAGSFIPTVALALRLVTFACAGIFVVASDLGKKKSYILAGIMLACSLILIVFAKGMGTNVYLGMIGKNALAIVFSIMVYAKYKDKEARGTK